MSRNISDEFPRPSRPRANTSSFPSFGNWGRRGRPDAVLASIESLPLSFEELLNALQPPAVPSLNHARALAVAVSHQNPKPRLAQLNSVLSSLCSASSPPAVQSAGFDILTSFYVNTDSHYHTTGDRLFSFSLLKDSSSVWSSDLWESRYRALEAFTKSGQETVGVESPLLKMLEAWVQAAFQGLITTNLTPEERTERQRSVETMTTYLVSLVSRSEFVARLSDQDVDGVLSMYGTLVDVSLSAVTNPHSGIGHVTSISPSPSPSVAIKHHRNLSSSSLPFVSRDPVDFSIEIYLKYLSIRLKAIAPDHITTILPHLFRALSYYTTPLPRLSLSHRSPQLHPIEDAVNNILDSLMTGPCSAACLFHLKQHFFPSTPCGATCIRTSLGALRTLRVSIRRCLICRMARTYISKTSSISYTPSGAPGQLDIENDLMERAWAKDDVAQWALNRFRTALCRSVGKWLQTECEGFADPTKVVADEILCEVAEIVKDVVHAYDEGADGDELDSEELEAVGQVLSELAKHVQPLTHADGSFIMISLAGGTHPLRFLTTMSEILAQDILSTPFYTVLPSIILSLAQHVSDEDESKLLTGMAERQLLSPTSPRWLEHWQAILSAPDHLILQRNLTRQVAMTALQSVWDFVKDIPIYRRPLAQLVLNSWQEYLRDIRGSPTSLTIWRILGDEVALRSTECFQDGSLEVLNDDICVKASNEILEFLNDIASKPCDDDSDGFGLNLADTTYPTSPASQLQSTTALPNPSRLQTDQNVGSKDSEGAIPSVMSLLSSITSGAPSTTKTRSPLNQDTRSFSRQSPLVDLNTIPRSAGPVVALVSAFTQLAFSTFTLREYQLQLAIHIFTSLIALISPSSSSRTKITVLQFFMRLRVDRDHRIYYASADYDRDGLITTTANQVSRVQAKGTVDEPITGEDSDSRRTVRAQAERKGRKISRGAERSTSAASRSRSRAPSRMAPSVASKAFVDPLWKTPDSVPFLVSAEADTPSESFTSYDPAGPGHRIVLPFSSYLAKLVELIRIEQDWEVLSYILCHLPTQLANKHLFCGPKSRKVISELLSTLSTGIIDGSLGSSIIYWPEGIINRDAHALAYHTLTVLISYKSCFKEILLQHRLVEVFLPGLSGNPASIKCCLQALSLCAFELPLSMTKHLPRILEKLSQIMSNPKMAVHIIELLSIVGSLPALHTNFTKADYKVVFGVALQYLQHHNRSEGSSSSISWALSQHVRIMSYYIIYLWFLAVKLPDRPQHVQFITRQLLLANEGRNEIDEPAEVCFDWLARYTYASADPRPAESTLSSIIFNPSSSEATEPSISEKTWIAGNSVVTIRTLARRGWIEVISRRASGLTKFLCRAENVPLVTSGDVNPDIVSLSSGLVLDRVSSKSTGAEDRQSHETHQVSSTVAAIGVSSLNRDAPDPITGYVWSGSAPSQRRKEVTIDPSYFALQLSSYPDSRKIATHRVVDKSKVNSFCRHIDRMPVIDTHKVGILYVAPGQSNEREILRNTHGSPAYGRFLEGLGRLINLRGQVDVYAGGLDPDEDGEYAFAWWDDIGQVLYHAATLMPPSNDEESVSKKAHIGNDFVRIIWNDSGLPYRFDTLSTQFQFVNIVVEPHSRGSIAAYSNNIHENEYFKVIVQRAPDMTEFTPVGQFKLISAENLPLLVRQLSLLADWFVSVFQVTERDTSQVEKLTNWRARLKAIKQFRAQVLTPGTRAEQMEGILGQETFRDFTTSY